MEQKRVMIVEDELIPALDLKLQLERHGVTCTGMFVSAEKALAAFETDPVDFLFLDVYLAGDMDGIDLAAALKGRAEIVFISASDDDITKARMASVNHRAVIQKPYNFSEILTAIRE